MHSRTAFIAAVSLGAVITAATASEPPRAPGAYVSLTTADAAACARACVDDGICMAWSFHRDSQCQLSAVVTAPNSQALAAGFASRAPTFLHPPAPIVQAENANVPARAAPLPPPAATEDLSPVATTENDSLLLGGPAEGDLRLGLR